MSFPIIFLLWNDCTLMQCVGLVCINSSAAWDASWFHDL